MPIPRKQQHEYTHRHTCNYASKSYIQTYEHQVKRSNMDLNIEKDARVCTYLYVHIYIYIYVRVWYMGDIEGLVYVDLSEETLRQQTRRRASC